MDSVKSVLLAFIFGVYDSVQGIALVIYIDEEIHRQNAEKELERQQRIQNQRKIRRSPSPVPSSASAMFKEELERERFVIQNENPDERNLESLLKKRQTTPRIPFREKKIAKQFLKCCALNGGFTWMSIILFEEIVLPALRFMLTLCYDENSQELHMASSWQQSILPIIFGTMWVMPLFLLCKLVSSLWFNDIANEAYKVRKGKPSSIPNFSKFLADFIFSLVVQAIFLVQSMLVNLLPFPYIGQILCALHLCLLYSLYSFEYKWIKMGWELHTRLNYIEINWPYFIGFGLPLTLLTNMSSSLIVSSCIFSIFFPLFILSGNEAKPIIGTTETALRLFSPTIFLSNLMFAGRRTIVNTTNRIVERKQSSQQQLQNKQENVIHHQRSTLSTSPMTTQTHIRSTQRMSTTRLTPERHSPADLNRSQIRYSGTNILIPTQVPRTTMTTTSRGKSTIQPR